MKHRSHTLFVHIPPDSAGKNNGKSTIHKKLNWLSGINFTPCKHKMIHKMKNCACMVHVYIFGEYILNVNNSQMNIKYNENLIFLECISECLIKLKFFFYKINFIKNMYNKHIASNRL